MKNYVLTAISKIKNKNTKNAVRAELEDHYYERISYYMEIGYDEETAKIKADEVMGDNAELVGEQLDAINNNYRIISVLFVLVNLIFLFFLALFNLFSEEPTTATIYTVSTAFTIISLIEMYVGVKYKLSLISFITAANFVLSFFMMKGYVPFVFSAFKLLKGESRYLVNLMCNHNWMCTNQFVYRLSIVFTVICICLSVFSAVLILKFNKMSFGKRDLKQEYAVKAVLIFLIIIIAAVFIFYCFLIHDDYQNYEMKESFEGVYVIESDEKVNPESIEEDDYNFLFIHFDWSDEDAHDDDDVFHYCDVYTDYIVTSETDADIKCQRDILYGEFQPSKDYVMVVPVFWDYSSNARYCDFSNSEWRSTSDEFIEESDEFQCFHIIVKYKIKIFEK